MSISTKKGDNKKSLTIINGKQIWIEKDDKFLEFIGQIDTLSATIMVAYHNVDDKKIRNICKIVAHKDIVDLYKALPTNVKSIQEFSSSHLAKIEQFCNDYEKSISIDRFCNGGSTKESAYLDFVRVTIRQTERQFISFLSKSAYSKLFNYYPILKYLNRLSDLYWLLARTLEQRDSKLELR